MIRKLKQAKNRIRFFAELKQKRRAKDFESSDAYWESRYAKGGDSGYGSYRRLAHFKAEFLNEFVKTNGVESVIEFGCGDGNQLSLAEYPRFIGLDVSRTILQKSSERFKDDDTKSFFVYDCKVFVDRAGVFTADLALSLDVVYHLVEDETFEKYMSDLFGAALRFVIVYSSNTDSRPDIHVRHRVFTDWVKAHASEWQLKEMVPNRHPFDPNSPEETSHADFYVFAKGL